jgi:transcriptional regulator with XRE-family HTH domain
MIKLKKFRELKGISQRNLAQLAGVSFRTLQLIEGGQHDPKISTLENIVRALGYPKNIFGEFFDKLFSQAPESIAMISNQILQEGEETWKIHLFNFVDAFRSAKNPTYYIQQAPQNLAPKMMALLSATVEILCEEKSISPPQWCTQIKDLPEPWFVSGVEYLKPMALVESPLPFRKRNIFVLDNFLNRA